ncbi:DUF817 domain-containing protein [Kaistia algarum]|uniref:DUF817 domain-containing protein n=1 Tax=Kaistia algarum TaxID=2083279 RepID=UPI000CE8C303|nr:DUF817 domain-containing protein [Kaistia algarum]MCX5513593.1 DUF817 domain-containing protein [Kaistia algarum]PPE77635.1 DUF817 domain-containing protein [Kaistia algarum]
MSGSSVRDPNRYGAYLEPARRRAHGVIDRLPAPLREFLIFGFKEAWASLFAGLMLGAILISKLVWQEGWLLARYDFLFLFAIAVQAAFLALKLERFDEAKVILLFHVVGTVMELFKTHMGSWQYPEANFFRIGGVPLFSGFLYSCVGSYIARSTRIFDLRYRNFPPLWLAGLVSALIYVNFFSHHFVPDMRIALFAATILVFGRTSVQFTVDQTPRRMPLVVAFLLIALFIWFAEVIGTASATWSYARTGLVSPAKFGSWYLLMILSYVLVLLVHPPRSFLAQVSADRLPSGVNLGS